MIDPVTLARYEAIAQRRLNAATTPKDRCVRALALMAIRLYAKDQARTSSGERATDTATAHKVPARVGLSPVDARGTSTSSLVPRPGPLTRAGVPSSPVVPPPEISVIVGSAATPTRRKGQRA
jgi:hypothetical protein